MNRFPINAAPEPLRDMLRTLFPDATEISSEMFDFTGNPRTLNVRAVHQDHNAPTQAEVAEVLRAKLEQLLPGVKVIPLQFDGPREPVKTDPPTKNEQRWVQMQRIASGLFDELSTERAVMASELRLIRAHIEESLTRLRVVANAIAEQDRRMAILDDITGGRNGESCSADHGESARGAPQGSEASLGRSAVQENAEPETQGGTAPRVS